jgi:hypothetical protein
MYPGLRAVFAIVYTVLYAFFALMASGSGHGSNMVIGPLITWVFYLIAFIFFHKFGTSIFYILMALHYSFILLELWGLTNGLDPNETKYWNSHPEVIFSTAAVYLAGQIVAWVWFYKSYKTADE